MEEDKAKLASGNVFADLGLPNPEQELLKGSPDAANLQDRRRPPGLTQGADRRILGIKQPHVSTLQCATARENFSVGRLLEFSPRSDKMLRLQ